MILQKNSQGNNATSIQVAGNLNIYSNNINSISNNAGNENNIDPDLVRAISDRTKNTVTWSKNVITQASLDINHSLKQLFKLRGGCFFDGLAPQLLFIERIDGLSYLGYQQELYLDILRKHVDSQKKPLVIAVPANDSASMLVLHILKERYGIQIEVKYKYPAAINLGDFLSNEPTCVDFTILSNVTILWGNGFKNKYTCLFPLCYVLQKVFTRKDKNIISRISNNFTPTNFIYVPKSSSEECAAWAINDRRKCRIQEVDVIDIINSTLSLDVNDAISVWSPVDHYFNCHSDIVEIKKYRRPTVTSVFSSVNNTIDINTAFSNAWISTWNCVAKMKSIDLECILSNEDYMEFFNLAIPHDY